MLQVVHHLEVAEFAHVEGRAAVHAISVRFEHVDEPRERREVVKGVADNAERRVGRLSVPGLAAVAVNETRRAAWSAPLLVSAPACSSDP